MRLYLMRHGEAGMAATDVQRELTEQGRADCRRVARAAFTRLEQPPKTLITSPYTRARQTAQIVAREIGFDGQLLVHSGLAPENSPATAAAVLNGLEGPVWLVAHQPLLGRLLSWLTEGGGEGNFPTAGVAALDLITPALGCGELRWRLAPEVA